MSSHVRSVLVRTQYIERRKTTRMSFLKEKSCYCTLPYPINHTMRNCVLCMRYTLLHVPTDIGGRSKASITHKCLYFMWLEKIKINIYKSLCLVN